MKVCSGLFIGYFNFLFHFFIKNLDKKPYKVYNSSNVSSESLLYTLYKNEVCHYGVLKKIDHHVLYDIIVLYSHLSQDNTIRTYSSRAAEGLAL